MSKIAATIRDVAKMAGVSVSTVSRVINESGYVGATTRTKVQKAMKSLGFSPNGIARGLVSGKTGSIGLLIPDVSNPFFSDIARGAEDAAISEGFTVILCNSDWQIEREQMYLDILHGKWVEGVIIAGSRSPEEILLDNIGNLPFALVDRQASHMGMSAWTDNERGAEVATSHLLEVGCKSLAFITGPADSPSAHARQLGFNKVVQSASIGNVQVVHGNFRYDGGYQAGLQLFSGGHLPDGVFAANDLMAVGVIQAAQFLGVRIPQDVAVIGYDNISMSTYIAPKLSTINQPGYEMGKAAFSILYHRLQDDKSILKDIEFEPELILRESTNRN